MAVDTAIERIKSKQYPAKVTQYTDSLLLVGISYERENKQHVCRIERFVHQPFASRSDVRNINYYTI